MSIFIQNDATGAGAGNLDPALAFTHLSLIADLDTGLGLGPQTGDRQQLIYTQSLMGTCPNRLNMLVNTSFQVDYGQGMGTQTVDIIILACKANFTLNDGSLVSSNGGVTLPPLGSLLAGDTLNTTQECLIIYDTTQNNGQPICVTRQGSGGVIDLPIPNAVIPYHELSHALRIVTNAQLALSSACNPSSPEEKAAMIDENDMRTQLDTIIGQPAELRDPDIYCAALCTGPTPPCCMIVATVASGSPASEEVQALRSLRDGFLRTSEVGFAFFDKLHYDYYDFSPQVCTLMVRQPALTGMVLRGFVRPLLRALQMMKACAIDGHGGAQLGMVFAEIHADAVETAQTVAALRRVQEFWTGEAAAGGDIERELSDLLRARALPSEHVNWALIEPVRIYGEALQAFAAGADALETGTMLENGFTAWAVDLPLDHFWASLNVRQLESELDFYETLLLRQPGAKARFRKRLADRFGDITAMQAVIGAAQLTDGALNG